MASHDVTAFFLLSKTVAEHLKVVQSGQGADEVFAGYAYHQPVLAAAREAALDTFTAAFADRPHSGMAEVLEPEWYCGVDVSRWRLQSELGKPGVETALDAVLRLDTHVLMPDDPVKRVDSMTMAWGLEARVPFLDQDRSPARAGAASPGPGKSCSSPVPPPSAGRGVAYVHPPPDAAGNGRN